MAHYFSAGRTSISAALKHLIELGYLRKNPGHGHPLRPQYRLTAKGKRVGAWAFSMDELLKPADWKVARRSWTLPILRESIPSRRFAELRSGLHPVTDRALSESLKVMGDRHWIARRVDAEASPPSVSYVPDGIGRVLVPCIESSFYLL